MVFPPSIMFGFFFFYISTSCQNDKSVLLTIPQIWCRTAWVCTLYTRRPVHWPPTIRLHLPPSCTTTAKSSTVASPWRSVALLFLTKRGTWNHFFHFRSLRTHLSNYVIKQFHCLIKLILCSKGEEWKCRGLSYSPPVIIPQRFLDWLPVLAFGWNLFTWGLF